MLMSKTTLKALSHLVPLCPCAPVPTPACVASCSHPYCPRMLTC